MKIKSFWGTFLLVFALIAVVVGGVVGVLALTKGEDGTESTSYTIQFLDYDGGVFDTQTISSGKDASAPSTNPSKVGYTFNGWEDYTNITGDRQVKSKWIRNESYLRTDWMSALTSANSSYTGPSINSIDFTQTVPSGSDFATVSVGATTSAGTNAFVAETSGVSDVTAYVKANSTDATKFDVIFYSPVTIYAPTSSSYLFSSESGDALANLKSISFNNFDTTNVTEMSGMFKNCVALGSLDLSTFDMSNVTNTSSMLEECSALTTIKAPRAMNSSISIALPTTGNYSSTGSSSTTIKSISSSNIGQTLVLAEEGGSEDPSEITDAYFLRGWLSKIKIKALNINSIKFVSTIPEGSDFTTVSVGATSITGQKALDTLKEDEKAEALDIIAYIKATEDDSTKYDIIFYSEGTIYAPEDSSELFGAWDNSDKLRVTSIVFDNFNTSKVTNMFAMFEKCFKLTTLDLSGFDTSNVSTMAWMFYGCTNLKSINLSSFDTSKVVTMYDMFYQCESLTSLNLSNFDTSEVTDMRWMFYECRSLSNLNLSSFDTSKITSLSNLFYKCSSLTSLDLSSFNTENVTTMQHMFGNCTQLISVNLSSFNTSKCTDLQSMFSCCFKLLSVDLSSFDTSNVTAFYHMFYGCYALTSVDLSSFDMSKATGATSVEDMFINCSSLSEIKAPKAIKSGISIELPEGTWVESDNRTKTVTSISNSNANKTIILATNTYTVTFDANGGECSTTTKIVLNDANYGNLPKATKEGFSFVGWFTEVEGGTQIMETTTVSLDSDQTLYAQWIDADKVLTITLNVQGATEAGTTKIYYKHGTNTYYSDPECTELLESITVPTRTGYAFNGYFTEKDGKGTQYIEVDGSFINRAFYNLSSFASDQTLYAKWTLIASYFNSSWKSSLTSANANFTAENILSIEFTNIQPTETGYTIVSVGKTALVNGTAWTKGCGVDDVLAYVKENSEDSTKYDVIFYSPVPICLISGESAFSGLTNLTSIKFGNLDTRYTTSMSSMFKDCSSLTSLNLSSLDTSSVTNMNSTFQNCSSLTNINFSNFDTSNVTSMFHMFASCSAFTSLDLSNFNTSNVTDMRYMFIKCYNLTEVNVSSFDTSNVANIIYMFSSCSSLKSLDLSSFDLSNAYGTYMFDGCTSLMEIKTPKAINSERTIDLPLGQWLDKDNSSNKYTTISSSNINKTLIYSSIYTVTFDANGGECSTTSKKVIYNTVNKCSYGSLPTATREGYAFLGWYTADGSKVESTTVVKTGSDHTLYARYEYTQLDVPFTVTLDNKGTTTAGTTYVYYKYKTNSFYSDLECTNELGSIVIPTKAYCSFVGYFTEENGKGTQYINDLGEFINDLQNISESQTLYAHFVIYDSYLNKNWRSVLITANSNYAGPNIATITFTNTMPSSYDDAVSVGATAIDGGTAWTSSTVGVNNIIAYIKANADDPTKYDIIICSLGTIYAPSNSSYLFGSSSTASNNLTNLTSLVLDNFNTSNVTEMKQMFYSCQSLTSLDVSKFDTSKVIDMGWMFQSCSKLTSLDLSSFNTSKVMIMNNMFSGCSKLTSLDLSSFNTSNVTEMSWMFFACESITSLNLSSFDTSRVKNMCDMFYSCQSLVNLNISSFNTSNVTNMSSMFAYCYSIRYLSLTNFDMTNVTNSSEMLKGLTPYSTIYTPTTMGSTTVELPTISGYEWKDASGNTYTEISSACAGTSIQLKN